MNWLSFPRALSVRVNCTPPPCTTTTWLPSRASSVMARMELARSSGVSSPAPPSLTTYFISDPPRRVSFQTLGFAPALHYIQILHSLRGRALQQVIETTDDDGAVAIGRELKADVGKACVHRVLNLGQRLREETHHGTSFVKIAIDFCDAFRGLGVRKPHVNSRENSRRNGRQRR